MNMFSVLSDVSQCCYNCKKWNIINFIQFLKELFDFLVLALNILEKTKISF